MPQPAAQRENFFEYQQMAEAAEAALEAALNIIANNFASIIITVVIKNIVIAITTVSIIMVRSINSNIVVTSSLRLQSCFHFLFSFTNSVTTVRWVTNIIAVIATNVVTNAITVLTITIVTITRLANIVGVITNNFASFIISVLIKNIVIVITTVGYIMVRCIKSYIVVTSSLTA
jgi:hypothetical protein